MRAGEIVRIDEQICRVDRVDRELIRIGDDFRNADAAEIVTVAELFADAGHHYNTGLPLFYTVRDGWHTPGKWWAGDRWADKHVDAIPKDFGETVADHIAKDETGRLRNISPAINLSRLPALDAWDALPEVIKAVVK